MATVRFSLTSPFTPEDALKVLTDFGPARADTWPTIDAEHLQVHSIGQNWAEVTEGTAAAWERARYEWDANTGRVEITTLESKVFGPGGGWTFQFSPVEGGTKVDVELTRTPTAFGKKILAAILPLAASSVKKNVAVPFQAR